MSIETPQLQTHRVNVLVGEVQPGATDCQLKLLVDAPAGTVSGHAVIKQATMPPLNIHVNNVTGRIFTFGVEPAKRVVELSGTYSETLPPPAIGTLTFEFGASLIIGEDDWDGRGSFTFGGHELRDQPVKHYGDDA